MIDYNLHRKKLSGTPWEESRDVEFFKSLKYVGRRFAIGYFDPASKAEWHIKGWAYYCHDGGWKRAESFLDAVEKLEHEFDDDTVVSIKLAVLKISLDKTG